jgi:hypothetical protein
MPMPNVPAGDLAEKPAALAMADSQDGRDCVNALEIGERAPRPRLARVILSPQSPDGIGQHPT